MADHVVKMGQGVGSASDPIGSGRIRMIETWKARRIRVGSTSDPMGILHFSVSRFGVCARVGKQHV